MIEPQNTMMPLAADPAPVDQPQGEEGFGAMLAQTLGMVPQLDPNAIQQITGRQGNGDQDAGEHGDGRHALFRRQVAVRQGGTGRLTQCAVSAGVNECGHVSRGCWVLGRKSIDTHARSSAMICSTTLSMVGA